MELKPRRPKIGTRDWWENLSKPERAAWISGGFAIAVVIIGIGGLLFSNTSGQDSPIPTPTHTSTPYLVADALTQTAIYLTQSPTPTPSPTLTTTPSPKPSNTYTPTLTATSTPWPTDEVPSITISEIMFAPPTDVIFRGTIKESRNEYVELYNFGDVPVDVGGWWISDSGATGEPDRLISWDDRFSDIPVSPSEGVITNSTLIPPKSYALILAPDYRYGDMPYKAEIEAGAIILTLADSGAEIQVIGKDGLSGTQENLDTLVLYIGTSEMIETPVSTYGTPEFGDSPLSIKDNEKDAIPYDLGEWQQIVNAGVKKKNLSAGDFTDNWEIMSGSERTPGRGE